MMLKRLLLIVVITLLLVPVSSAAAQDRLSEDVHDLIGRYRTQVPALADFLDGITSPQARLPVFAVGVALLVAGHVLFLIVLFLQGFVLGAGAGLIANGQEIWLALVGGVLGGVLALVLYAIFIFVSGFLVGGVLGGGLLVLVGAQGELNIVVALVCGVIGGFIALALDKLFQILVSALTGTFLIGITTGLTDSVALLAVIFAVGVAVQFGWVYTHDPSRLRPQPRPARADAQTAQQPG